MKSVEAVQELARGLREKIELVQNKASIAVAEQTQIEIAGTPRLALADIVVAGNNRLEYVNEGTGGRQSFVRFKRSVTSIYG